ncbi:imidazoleglycerol-phosphate dehydratase [Striga asiatica]|uniref:imidazoleglycerol-phosphate dehydratase n=1 Tax=Striga asiatica TaxID=4170 RepID=A0A5A7NX58_STRAF|nr:imidazoleglycerol-phosphate dehydratase [Striga asiatica]
MELSIAQRSVNNTFWSQSRLFNSPVHLSPRVFLSVHLQQRKVHLFSQYLTAPRMKSTVPHAVGNNGSPSIAIAHGGRIGEVKRVTKETNVNVKINLDGSAIAENNTGIPFLDHMLDQLASHGLFDVHVKATGDIHIDDHHTNEDVALAIGTSLLQALGDRKGINRFGDFSAPLGEALVHVALDLSGRPHLSYDLHIPTERVGTYDTQLVEHFFQSLVNTSGMALHIRQENVCIFVDPLIHQNLCKKFFDNAHLSKNLRISKITFTVVNSVCLSNLYFLNGWTLIIENSLLGGILTTSLRQRSRPLQGPFGKQRSTILAVEEVCQALKVSSLDRDASSILPYWMPARPTKPLIFKKEKASKTTAGKLSNGPCPHIDLQASRSKPPRWPRPRLGLTNEDHQPRDLSPGLTALKRRLTYGYVL